MKYTFDSEEIGKMTVNEVGAVVARTPVYAVKAVAGTLSFSVRAIGWMAGQLATVADATAKSLDKK